MRCVAVVLAVLLACGAVAHAQAGDWTVRRDPFDAGVIARYKALLARRPHDRGALAALVTLYRRHRTLDLLVREYETARTAHDDAPTVVVLARLAQTRKDNRRALELFRTAVSLAPDDVASWLAIGTLALASSDRVAARAAFREAANHARSSAQRIAALRQAADLAVDARDANAADTLYDELTTLAPRDGRLQLDRGDALARLGRNERALEAYAAAETLLARDPERRLLAIAAQGHVLVRTHQRERAVAEYERAIAASPPHYYLRRELATRIADVHEAAHDTKALREVLAKTVRADPTYDVMQWRLIRLYDKQGYGGLAHAQLRAAVKASPKNVALVLELAQRIAADVSDVPDPQDIGDVVDLHVRDGELRRAHRLVADLSRAYPRDAETHAAIGEVYVRWREPAKAVHEYELAAKLEPDDQRYIALGEAYLENDQFGEAVDAWRHLAADGSARGHARLAQLLLDHEMWHQAIEAFTTAMFDDTQNPALWRGRALAFAAIDDWDAALSDAEHAVELVDLLGPATYDAGLEVRSTLVRLLEERVEEREEQRGDDRPLRAHLIAWGKAFRGKAPDRQAGYLLAVYLGRHPGATQIAVLYKLRDLVPADTGVALELVRAHRLAHEYDDAIAVARKVAAVEPMRAKEVKQLVASIEVDRQRYLEDEARHAMLETDEPNILDRWGRRGSPRKVPLVAAARLGLGAGVTGDSTRTLTLGSWDAVPVAHGLSAIIRADWTQHVARMRSVNAVALGLGVGRPQLVSANTALTVATTARAELRVGELSRGPWERWAFSADVAVDVTSRHLPASIGLRYEHPIADPARGPMLLVEVAVGFRCIDFHPLSGGSGACR